MRAAAQVFCLASLALPGTSRADSRATTGTHSDSPDLDAKATVSDTCASYSTIDDLNSALIPSLQSLTQTTDFFSYYRLNLYNRVCPFWSDANSMCGNIACAVETLESEDDIPEIWRAEELGKVEGPKAGHPGKKLRQERGDERPLLGELGENVGESCVVEYDDECDERDYCIPDDEGSSGKGDYVSLVNNPERFTGYDGPSSRQVWYSIYRENCFSKAKSIRSGVPDTSSVFDPLGQQAAIDLRGVMREHGRQQALAKSGGMQHVDESLEFDDECLEKRVFYRIISGMHASISTHLCWDYLNQSTGNWGPNLQCYEDRLHKHSERISNLYFNYALVLRAVAKLRGHLKDYTFCSGDPSQDRMTKQKANDLADRATASPRIFDESLMFQDSSVEGLKEDFRNRFRNVSRLMDCVGCDKCRLWGKLQTAGYGAALKVLFEFDEFDQKKNPPLRRTELVALVNTLDRISHSLTALKNFRAIRQAKGNGTPMSEEEIHTLYDRHQADPFDNYEEADQHEDPHDPHSQTLADIFWDEWRNVWHAFRLVIRSWIELPQIMLYHPSLLQLPPQINLRHKCGSLVIDITSFSPRQPDAGLGSSVYPSRLAHGKFGDQSR
ncbi:MAG: endoplasmic oxidoreductin-1 [Geoglossum umbratile]|nr:MAG: endoplasmic oxidoreductin-1 [Geoglossum umbratile]